MKKKLLPSSFIKFCLTFLLIFFALYGGTIMLIGLSTPGNYYSPFIDQQLNYVEWLKGSLQYGVVKLMGLADISTTVFPNYEINITNGRGIIINNSCVGYGVYSFWIAYIIANRGKALGKFYWIAGGLLLLWSINVVRIALFLYTINKSQRMPLGLDHHTWFNIAAYLAIFIMMYFFENRKSTGDRGASTTFTESESTIVKSNVTHE